MMPRWSRALTQAFKTRLRSIFHSRSTCQLAGDPRGNEAAHRHGLWDPPWAAWCNLLPRKHTTDAAFEKGRVGFWCPLAPSARATTDAQKAHWPPSGVCAPDPRWVCVFEQRGGPKASYIAWIETSSEKRKRETYQESLGDAEPRQQDVW
jgi:hypothetical protein